MITKCLMMTLLSIFLWLLLLKIIKTEESVKKMVLRFEDGEEFSWGLYSEKAWRTNHRKDKNIESLSYALLGLIGETGEVIEAASGVDSSVLRKEIGDVLWYCNSICVLCGVSFSDTIIFMHSNEISDEPHFKVMRDLASFSEFIKKQVFHKNVELSDIKEDVFNFIRSKIVPYVSDLSEKVGSNLESDAILNISKLSIRYSGAEYTEEKFDERVDTKHEQS